MAPGGDYSEKIVFGYLELFQFPSFISGSIHFFKIMVGISLGLLEARKISQLHFRISDQLRSKPEISFSVLACNEQSSGEKSKTKRIKDLRSFRSCHFPFPPHFFL